MVASAVAVQAAEVYSPGPGSEQASHGALPLALHVEPAMQPPVVGEEVGDVKGEFEGVGEALPSPPPPPPPEVHSFEVSHVPEEHAQAVRSAVGVEPVTQGVHAVSADGAHAVAMYSPAAQVEQSPQKGASVPFAEVVLPPAQTAHCRSFVGVHARRKVPGMPTHVEGVSLQGSQEPDCAETSSDHVSSGHDAHVVSAVAVQPSSM